MRPNRYSLPQAAKAAGLEVHELRFFRRAFRDFFDSAEGDEEFSRGDVETLARIRELVRIRGLEIAEARRELKAALRKSPDPGAQAQPAPPRLQPRRAARVISIVSGKGGVGKTTVAVNLALAFAQLDRRVALFDADLGMANAHILMGLRPRMNVRHMVEKNARLEDVMIEGPLGVKVIAGGQGMRELANLSPDRRRTILRHLDRLEREVDILLLDCGAGISEDVLRFANFADEIVVVTTPELTSATDAYSIVKILFEMDGDNRIGVVANEVENMYHSRNVFNRLNAAAREYLHKSLDDLGYVVEDPHVRTAGRAHKPLVLSHPESPAARCIENVARTILREDLFRNRAKDSSFGELMGEMKRQVGRA